AVVWRDAGPAGGQQDGRGAADLLGHGHRDVGVGHHVHLDRGETALEEPGLDGGAGGVLAGAVGGGGGGDDDDTTSAGIDRRGPGVRAGALVVVVDVAVGLPGPVTPFAAGLGGQADPVH